MEIFLEVLHVYIKNLVLFLVIMVTIFAGYSSFEWLKLTHMTNWSSQCIEMTSSSYESVLTTQN